MAARSAPRGHLCRRLCYCVEQVEEIMRTEATWMVWPPMDALALPVLPPAELPLAEPPLAEPVDPVVEPLPLAEPPLGEPEPPVPPEMLDEEEVSEPVTSTWCPLCCVSSVSRPCRVYVDPLIAMLPEAPLPLVPAVAPPAEPLVDPVEPAPDAEPAPPLAEAPLLLPGDVEPLALPPAPVLPDIDPEPIRAFVSMKVPLPIERELLDAEPAVPLVPVAPGVLPLP